MRRHNGQTRSGSQGRRRSGPLDVAVNSWIDCLEREIEALADHTPNAPLLPERATPDRRRPAKATGDSVLVTCSDTLGGTLVIRRIAVGLQHRGTIAPRGPSAPKRAAYLGLGLSEEHARAIEFVADWFGAPFDAVNVLHRERYPLSWGIWGFAGASLARCLAAWKSTAQDTFATLLGGHGIDVQTPAADDSRHVPALTVIGPNAGTVRGDEAERMIASDPRLLAVLARAGHHEAGQLAQLRFLASDVLAPALSSAFGADGVGIRLSNVLQSARGVALLLYLDLRLGPLSLREVTRAVTRRPPDPRPEGTILQGFVDYLQQTGRDLDAHNALRILSSPELEVG